MESSCIGVVLAGGKSTRMGSNKALLLRNKQPMLAFAKTQLKDCGLDKVVVSGDMEGAIPDVFPNGGPLAGVHAIASRYKPKALLILPVDMPLMTSKVLTQLVTYGQKNAIATYFNHVRLPCYVPITSSLIEYLEHAFNDDKFIDSGRGPSLRTLLDVIGSQSITIKDEQSLINTNTPAQWQQSQALFSP